MATATPEIRPKPSAKQLQSAMLFQMLRLWPGYAWKMIWAGKAKRNDSAFRDVLEEEMSLEAMNRVQKRFGLSPEDIAELLKSAPNLEDRMDNWWKFWQK